MNRQLNKRLKFALIDREMKQRELARAAGMGEATLSLIINGVYVPSTEQQTTIARILNKSPGDLF